jgi:hypothetical protein
MNEETKQALEELFAIEGEYAAVAYGSYLRRFIGAAGDAVKLVEPMGDEARQLSTVVDAATSCFILQFGKHLKERGE